MLTTYRFRLYPTRTQERLLNETLETCRLLYNWMLAERRENHVGFYEQKKTLVELKKREKHLRAVDSQVLQDVVLRLDKAHHAFYIGLVRRPRFKRKGRYNSFRYPATRRVQGHREGAEALKDWLGQDEVTSPGRGDAEDLHHNQGHRPMVRLHFSGG